MDSNEGSYECIGSAIEGKFGAIARLVVKKLVR